MTSLKKRKNDHLSLAKQACVPLSCQDHRFNYEPLLSSHLDESFLKTSFLGKTLKAPLWVGAMTGGTKKGEVINKRLAQAVNKFSLGMTLGSCRPLLENKKNLNTFNVRPILGPDRPLYANLGIAQIEKLLALGQEEKVEELVDLLKADGICIHINPLQEFLQIEGDKFKRPPLQTLEEFLGKTSLSLIVKEVGQGFGPKSLTHLLKLPLKAIELSGFGGTNFSKLEILRQDKNAHFYNPLTRVGHCAQEMIDMINFEAQNSAYKGKVTEFILSGGIENFLDAHYLMEKFRTKKVTCVYAQASALLEHASKNEKELFSFIDHSLKGLIMARCFLKLKEND